MMEDVGEVLPLRLGKEFELYVEAGYREVYVPAVDIADDGKLFEVSC